MVELCAEILVGSVSENCEFLFSGRLDHHARGYDDGDVEISVQLRNHVVSFDDGTHTDHVTSTQG